LERDLRQSRQRRRGCHGVESLSRSAPLTSISPPASKFTIQRPRHWLNACSTPLCTSALSACSAIHVGGYGAQLRHAAELSPVERVRELEARRHRPGKTCHTPTFPQLACSCRRARGTGPLCPQCQRGRAAAAAAALQHGQPSLQSAACAREAAVRQARRRGPKRRRSWQVRAYSSHVL